jgi:hypothetical protein
MRGCAQALRWISPLRSGTQALRSAPRKCSRRRFGNPVRRNPRERTRGVVRAKTRNETARDCNGLNSVRCFAGQWPTRYLGLLVSWWLVGKWDLFASTTPARGFRSPAGDLRQVVWFGRRCQQRPQATLTVETVYNYFLPKAQTGSFLSVYKGCRAETIFKVLG